MKKFLIAATALSSLLAIANSASAADAFVDPGYDWTGGYIGLEGGYAWGDSKGGDYTIAGNVLDVEGDLDPDGFLGGLFAGYNHQFANGFVLGIEGDMKFGDVHGSTLLHDAAGVVVPGNSATSEVDWTGSARLRAGVAVNRFLPFVTGGLAIANYDFNPDYAATPLLPGSNTSVGWTVGAGLEYAVTDNLTTRIEYRYADYGKDKYPIPGFPAFQSIVDLQTSDISFGLSYKF